MDIRNINKSNLGGKRIGIIIGEFIPLHTGHQKLIYKALMKNDSVFLIVCGVEGDSGDINNLSLQKRFRYLREAYNDELNLKVLMVEDTISMDLPSKIVSLVKSNIEGDFESIKFVIYTSEDMNLEQTQQLLPDNFYLDIQKIKNLKTLELSIQKNPIKYWDKINPIFQRNFTKKVLIAGSASTGKSTLVRRLAHSFNTTFSEEYARAYQEEANVTDEELTVKDYASIAIGQCEENYKETCSIANKGITFFDTDIIVTKTYSDLYLKKTEKEELEHLFDIYISKENYDLILIIPPITNYIDDGFRNMTWEKDRYEFHRRLMFNFSKYGFKDKIILLDHEGVDTSDGFYLRYEQALAAINKALGFNLK